MIDERVRNNNGRCTRCGADISAPGATITDNGKILCKHCGSAVGKEENDKTETDDDTE